MGFALSDMRVTSSSFENLATIPELHTADGDNTSPPLAWDGVSDADSYAVFCHDPDAPLVRENRYGFVHWVLYNLPGDTRSLEPATTAGTAGTNDYGEPGYRGPRPPEDHGQHAYYFWVIGLSGAPDFDAGLSLWDFLEQAEPYITGMNRLVGKYSR